MSSAVSWRDQGVVITQQAGFPVSITSTTSISVSGNPKSTFTLAIRVPGWSRSVGNSITVNGQPLYGELTPGTYMSIHRAWTDGDVVGVYFAMQLTSVPLVDTRPRYNATMAFMYGPLVLAGLTGSAMFQPNGTATDPSSFIIRNSTEQLTFEAVGRLDSTEPFKPMAMIPLMDVTDEGYAPAVEH